MLERAHPINTNLNATRPPFDPHCNLKMRNTAKFTVRIFVSPYYLEVFRRHFFFLNVCIPYTCVKTQLTCKINYWGMHLIPGKMMSLRKLAQLLLRQDFKLHCCAGELQYDSLEVLHDRLKVLRVTIVDTGPTHHDESPMLSPLILHCRASVRLRSTQFSAASTEQPERHINHDAE